MSNTTPESESSALVQNSNAPESLEEFPQSTERTRKCCPDCGSIRVSRRISKGGYVCNKCLKVFYEPEYKQVKTGKVPIGRQPAALVKGVQA